MDITPAVARLTPSSGASSSPSNESNPQPATEEKDREPHSHRSRDAIEVPADRPHMTEKQNGRQHYAPNEKGSNDAPLNARGERHGQAQAEYRPELPERALAVSNDQTRDD